MIKGKEGFATQEVNFDTGDGLSQWDTAVEKLEGKLNSNTEYTIYLCDKKKSRSLAANRYYWGVVIKAVEEHTGIDTEDLHEFFKFHFTGKKTLEFDGFEKTEISRSTKSLDQEEFIDYTEKIRVWAMEKLDCYIPTPVEIGDPAYEELYVKATDAKI